MERVFIKIKRKSEYFVIEKYIFFQKYVILKNIGLFYEEEL